MNELNPETITMYGAHWCPDCVRAKQFFGEHRIQYDYIDIEEHPETVEFIKSVNDGMRIIPTIIFPDGRKLAEPSNAEMAEALDIQTRAAHNFYDAIIVGAGPTGLTAAMYLEREGQSVLVIDKAGAGGQAAITQVLDNFPGFDKGISGDEFAKRLTRQAKRFGAEIIQAQAVTKLEQDGQYWCVHTSDGNNYGTNAVLIATGAKYRRLNVPGESDLIGINIHFCATCDGAFYKDKKVLVVGGGNSGFEEGLFLTRFASQVDIAEYKKQPAASSILQEKVAEQDNMTVRTSRSVDSFEVKDGELGEIKVKNTQTDEIETWDYDGVFVFIGLSPNNDLVAETVETDAAGFIATDDRLMTSLDGIFAAGDVRSGSTKQAASAVGEGATAALMMRRYLSEKTV